MICNSNRAPPISENNLASIYNCLNSISGNHAVTSRQFWPSMRLNWTNVRLQPFCNCHSIQFVKMQILPASKKEGSIDITAGLDGRDFQVLRSETVHGWIHLAAAIRGNRSEYDWHTQTLGNVKINHFSKKHEKHSWTNRTIFIFVLSMLAVIQLSYIGNG